MEINNLDYVGKHTGSSASYSGQLYGRGIAHTYAHTNAGPGLGLADAAALAAGQESLALAVTHALAQESQHSQSSYGNAAAYAYGIGAKRMKDSYAISSSRYRATAFSGRITATSSFSSHY